MNKKSIIRYLQSIVAFPMLAMALPLSGVPAIPPIPGITAIDNNPAEESSVIITQEEIVRKEKADAINAYFAKIKAPLEGYGIKFVLEAEKNGIDWRLLPAIAMRESTGGIHACKSVPNSVFGWGSCKISFNSIDESIEIVAENLGGNNPKTDHHYEDKTVTQILKKYNSVIPGYSSQVIKIMKAIKDDGQEIK